MHELKAIEANGQRVLTTKQIAEAYGTDPERIKLNYRYNKKRFIDGKHIIPIEGEELRHFKTRYQFDSSFKYAKSLYLWTEKGALLHAKSLNTDKAWEVYEYLVDYYFRAEDTKRQQSPVQKQEEQGKLVVDAPENIKIIEAARKVKDDLTCLRVLLDQCNKFISMEEYERRRKQALDAVNIIRADMLQFSILDPRMVRKAY